MLNNRVFIINRSVLEDRFDPIFYSSDLAKFNTNIFKSVLLKSIVKYFKSGFGAGKQEQTDAENGIIQIRPTNIDENGFLKYDKNIYLPIDKNSIRIEVDDILFNNTNSQELVGKTAILKENKELTFSNHITIIRVRKEAILPDYLWIILNMYQRNRIFYSICTNWNNQSGIGLELLKKLKIPLPPLEIQQQIVDLYEKAYSEKQQKEAEAQRLLDSIDDYLLGELGITLPKEEEELLPQNTDENSSYNLDNDNPLVKKGRLFLTNLSEVTGKRWNAFEFKNRKLKLGVGKYPNKTLKHLAYLLKGQSITSNEIEKGDYPVIAGGQISPYTHNRYNFKGNVITISASGAYSGYVWYHNYPIFASDCTVVFSKEESEITTLYLSEILKLKQKEIYNLQQGAGQPHVYARDLEKINIPIPSLQKQKDITNKITAIREKAKKLQLEALDTLEIAKREIEQMILGD